nr:ribonuclease H-like domain-containing protein [Tanacetum cinerariifolium]
KFPTGNTKFSTADLGNKGKAVKASACWIWKPTQNLSRKDSGCFRHMTGNISYLSDYEPFNEGYVSFGQGGCQITGKGTIKTGYVSFGQGGCQITGKGTIKTGKLKFENVYFVKDLKYNLFSVSQICDNKNSVLFTDSECIGLGRDFKLIHDTNMLLRTPRQHNMYSIDLKNIIPHKDLTCLVAKASADESMLWHRRLGHLNFKTMNKLVRHNLVRGLPTKCFENDHTCTTCLKGKQRKASCTHSTNLSGTKDAASQEVKKDVSSLRYIALPNWVHDALLESPSNNAQDTCKANAPESIGNPNPTASIINPLADQIETLIVETPIPTVSSPVSTAYFTDSQEPSSDTRLISKRVTNQEETPSLDNILTLTNRFEDIIRVTTNSDDSNGVEVYVSSMETTIIASPTPTLRIHKDHPKVR